MTAIDITILKKQKYSTDSIYKLKEAFNPLPYSVLIKLNTFLN